MRVSFLVAGVQRGGTTSLDAWLRQHPSVCMANRKEVHFFDSDDHFRSPPDYRGYHRLFSPREDALCGESTPIYLYWADAARRIWQYSPLMRLIVLLRCPAEWAWSHWRLERSRGAEALAFSEAIRQESERSRAALPAQHRVFSYTDRGFYGEQIRRLRRFFPDEQLLFVKSENFFADPQRELDRICGFLGIGSMRFDVREQHQQSADCGVMPAADRAYLRASCSATTPRRWRPCWGGGPGLAGVIGCG